MYDGVNSVGSGWSEVTLSFEYDNNEAICFETRKQLLRRLRFRN
jgi:hypothetical protein